MSGLLAPPAPGGGDPPSHLPAGGLDDLHSGSPTYRGAFQYRVISEEGLMTAADPDLADADAGADTNPDADFDAGHFPIDADCEDQDDEDNYYDYKSEHTRFDSAYKYTYTGNPFKGNLHGRVGKGTREWSKYWWKAPMMPAKWPKKPRHKQVIKRGDMAPDGGFDDMLDQRGIRVRPGHLYARSK
ncbi:hypothetical protein H2200_000127 [Cladophialophora chaetospira]|uniref:Uncharacterized protein n=1 Tax=Cladophialophora chaetospira TaxID=386627 RepID=A0AA38XNW8_9EURO|nr:hypothetical protein H2200_000127 [Cladophialophora chaetospira]